MIERGATHIGVATDHVVESFRNDLYAGYKTSEGVPPPLLAQFRSSRTALLSLGVVVWPMVEFEADDALASAAAGPRVDPHGRPSRDLHTRQGSRAVHCGNARRAAGSPPRRRSR